MTAPNNVVLLAVGSGGDVAPFVSIGNAFARRGIATTLYAPARYAHYTTDGAITFESIGAEDVFEDIFNGEDIWHPTRGLAASWRYYAAAMQGAYEKVGARFRSSDTMLVSSSFAVGARALQSRRGFANATVHLSPAVIFSHERPARWATSAIPPNWPTWLKRVLARSAERFAVNPTIRGAISPVAEKIGLDLPPYLFSSWVHSPSRVFYAFPTWFANPAADWPANGVHVSFPLGVGSSGEISPELTEFMARSQSPLAVVTAGTAVNAAPAWMRSTCVSLMRAGWKVLLVGPEQANVLSGIDPHKLYSCRHVPFTKLFAQSQLVVHHGGIGTMCEALRAGVPQLLFPSAHDQPDNAVRLAQLGAGIDGSQLSPWSDAGATIAAQLDSLRHAASRIRNQLLAEPPAEELIADQVIADWKAVHP